MNEIITDIAFYNIFHSTIKLQYTFAFISEIQNDSKADVSCLYVTTNNL
jgi:hypothetical protein